jgi:hypothetical protein
MALIAEGQLEPSEINFVNRKAAERSAGFFSRLSLFWADQHFSVGRFPPLDKVDYIDHAVPLLESRRVYPARPIQLKGYWSAIYAREGDGWKKRMLISNVTPAPAPAQTK